MPNAYNKLYLEDAMDNLGSMFDYVINILKIDKDKFINMFMESKIISYFELGHPSYVSGCSGSELAHKLFEEHKLDVKSLNDVKIYYSKEYWIGYSLAYYQWYSGLRFKDILKIVDYNHLDFMYKTYHEMDINRFVEEINRLMSEYNQETNLARFRKMCKLSQKELAIKSGVSLRMIQLYEQRVNDINKASAIVLYKLSVILKVDMRDLLETKTLITRD